VSVAADTREAGGDQAFKLVAQAGQAGGFIGQVVNCQIHGGGQGDNLRHGQCAAAQAALVSAAFNLRGQAHGAIATAHVQPADTLGAVELMGRERE